MRASGPQPVYFPLGGGLDLVTSPVSMAPGRAIAALNYDPSTVGYSRLRGFERFSGRTAPSSITSVTIINFTNGRSDRTNTVLASGVMADETVNGTFYVMKTVITSGAFPLTAAGYMVVHMLSGTIVDGDDLYEDAGTSFTSYALADGELTTTLPVGEDYDTLLRYQIEFFRNQIQAPPGTGAVRGIAYLDGFLYAFRDNGTGGTTISKSSTSLLGGGWDNVGIGRTLAFYQGTVEPGVGVVITGVTSGATATISQVVLVAGTWAVGNAGGYFIVYNETGSFIPNEMISFPGHASAIKIYSAASTAGILPSGGRFQFIYENFFGAADLRRIYGVNGVGYPFQFDGTHIIPFATGMPVETPTRIAAYRKQLFLMFPGGSVQFSEVGEPTTFDPVLGAGEITIGEEGTDFVSLPNALGILGENSVNVLYGHDASDFELQTLNREAGGLAWTAQAVTGGIYMDNVGIRSLAATQAYGNFRMGAMSEAVAPLLEELRSNGISPVGSLVLRKRNQYWVFFSDGSGLVVNLAAKVPAIMPINLGKVITCTCSIEDHGVERAFFGSDDGFIYELDKGTSFDGEAVEHYLRLAFDHFGTPHVKKRIHRVSVDMKASGVTTISVAADFDYGAAEGTAAEELVVTTGGADLTGLGSNEAYYASQIETVADAYLDGVAKNISLKISGSTVYEEPHTLTGVTYHITPRGLER